MNLFASSGMAGNGFMACMRLMIFSRSALSLRVLLQTRDTTGSQAITATARRIFCFRHSSPYPARHRDAPVSKNSITHFPGIRVTTIGLWELVESDKIFC